MRKINELIQKDMTRREFLATIGLSVVTLFGFGALTRLLGGENSGKRASEYGSGTYGGPQQSRS